MSFRSPQAPTLQVQMDIEYTRPVDTPPSFNIILGARGNLRFGYRLYLRLEILHRRVAHQGGQGAINRNVAAIC